MRVYFTSSFSAVADALETQHLAGYAADVFVCEDQSLTNRPQAIPAKLLAMSDKTVFTPHIGSAVTSVRKQIEALSAKIASLSQPTGHH